MAGELFDGRMIEVLDISDVISGERVIEFRDHLKWGNDTVVAIAIPDGGHWADATVSINPRVGDIPVGLLVWAIGLAEEKTS
jgi:hypothetical protein